MKTIKHYMRIVLPVLMAAVMMVACSSNKDKEGAFIPKDAYFVADINVASIWQKGELANAEQLGSIQMVRSALEASAPEFNNLFGNILKDPSSCGINMERNISFFMTEKMVGITATLKDQKTFEDFIATLNKEGDGIKTEKDGSLKVINFANEFVGVYDENHLVFAFDTKSCSDLESQKNYAKSLFDLDIDESMADDENYEKYLAERQDINFYASYANILKLSGGLALSQMQSLMPKETFEALEKTSIYYTLSFENGSIDINGDYIGLPDEFTKLMSQDFNAKLLGYMPEQTLAALTFAVKPSFLYDLISANPALKPFMSEDTEFGSVKEIFEAFGGSFAASFYGMNGDTPLFAVVCDIKNATLVANIMNSLEVENGKDIPGTAIKVFYNNEVLLVTSDAAVVSAAQNGGNANGMTLIADKAKKGNYFYMNLKVQDYPQEIINALGIGSDPTVATLLGMLDNLEFTSNNAAHSTVKINLTNTSTNSLAYMLQVFDMLAMGNN